ncbi:Pr6Pr family membrane protein [Kitasatospora sp. NPDC048540]|uniref:Pr6Pr family membrane protein n=1 Tax=unclassified Kitasatospora TaxID=2633591 RepID=UPI000A698E29|nr:Pr6Pr family membrane protein [Kitasatospora sp. MBT63]
MSVRTRPALWWRLGIVLSAGLGLILGNSSLVYFTTESNVIVLGYFAAAVHWMVRRGTVDAPAPRLRGAVTLYITITGLVAHILLNHGANPLPGLGPGPDRLQNWSSFLLHYTTPLMVLADWLCLKPRNASRWRDLPLWLSFPLGYAVVTEVRAALFPSFPLKYPYFFLDPTTNGHAWVAGQIAQLTVEFVLLGAAVVGLDRLGTLINRRLRPATAPTAAPTARSEAPAPGVTRAAG